MGIDGIPQQYNASMKHYKLGYAFYEPESSLDVKPGACGYIDESGSWHRIVDVTNTVATQNAGYQSIDKTNLIKLRPSKRNWGPRFTETVDYKRMSIEAGASALPAGIPAEASVLIEFSMDSDFGAVLMCKDEVTKQGYDHADPFRDWAKANAEKLLKQFSSLRKYGFYVVVTTFTAKDVFINGWTQQSHKVALGFKAGVTHVGEIAPATEFYGADSASGWVNPICKGRSIFTGCQVHANW
jgi:hypothetical protein